MIYLSLVLLYSDTGPYEYEDVELINWVHYYWFALLAYTTRSFRVQDLLMSDTS